MIWRAMTFFALLLSIAAFAIAVMAYQQAGGDLKQLRQAAETTRRGTANALDKLEDFVRGPQRRDIEAARRSN